MRKLALAGVMAAAMIGAGFFAWQAEATTPSAAATLGATGQELFAGQGDRLQGLGAPLPAGVHLALWTGPVLVPPLLD